MKRHNPKSRLGGRCLLSAPVPFSQAPTIPRRRTLPVQVRHQFVMIPYYSVFDDLNYSVDNNGVVTLSGDVVNPVVKNDAGTA